LTGDFAGDLSALDQVLDAAPDVFAHNLETVPRLAREVRVQASYPRSYAVLAHASRRGLLSKTGLMLGLGETIDEVRAVLREVRTIGVEILTLGQYLRPFAPTPAGVTPRAARRIRPTQTGGTGPGLCPR